MSKEEVDNSVTVDIRGEQQIITGNLGLPALPHTQEHQNNCGVTRAGKGPESSSWCFFLKKEVIPGLCIGEMHAAILLKGTKQTKSGLQSR
mgnify:CR=1 FL=1